MIIFFQKFRGARAPPAPHVAPPVLSSTFDAGPPKQADHPNKHNSVEWARRPNDENYKQGISKIQLESFNEG